MRTAIRAASALAVLALVSAPVHAADGVVGAANASPDQFVQVAPVLEGGETYGTTTQTVFTARIQSFLPPASTITWATTNTGGIYVNQTSAGSADWWGQINIPNGAIVERVEMQACDTTATGNIVFGVARMDAPASTGVNVTPIGDTGAAATPGCAFFSVTPNGGSFQVDNRNASYLIFVDWFGNFTNANKVAGFRIFYRLQVSPAPATASFPNDVPTTHPFFRFIEALARSGVTGGCATGSYCPNDPVTRGQMAVFLATALGLHFPN